MRQKVLNIYALPSGQSAERGIDGIYFLFLWSCFFSHGVCGFGLSQEGQFFLHWVAWFGIIHGLNEWLDMFIMVRAMELTVFLEFFRMMTLPLSFLCLVYFGAEVISSQNSKCRFCKFITPVLLVIWAGVFFLGVHSGLRWDIWSRYLLCFTGSTLTGIALWMHVSEIETTENTKLAFYLKVAGAAFVFYGVLAGLIVPDADFFPSSVLNYSLFSSGLEIPIQVFRSLCAVVIAYYLIRVLKIFQWETRQTLYNSELRFKTVVDSELRFKTVVDTAPVILFMTDTEQKISFFEGKSVESLGIRAADVLGRSVAEVFSHIPQVSESTQKALAGEKITSTVPIGDSYFEVFLAPFRSRRGKIQGMTGVAVDVTQQKAAQAQMDKYRYDMEKNKALAAIGSLSTEIAKDMIDPLHESKVSLLKASSGLRNTIGA
ncbi:MAG: PAS domain-containing protein, partial [Planctomycetota bacterium]